MIHRRLSRICNKVFAYGSTDLIRLSRFGVKISHYRGLAPTISVNNPRVCRSLICVFAAVSALILTSDGSRGLAATAWLCQAAFGVVLVLTRTA